MFHPETIRVFSSEPIACKISALDQRKTVFGTQVGENHKNGICLTGLSLVMESLDIVVSF
jgi:hypothetical protein